ncbi:germination protein YpeB [Sediminibacillus massiliensis]|uniref:germination protein YpeB n=1 Tax=Sediminibacillus massiliensis TaxID=1926277 RepID=UPI0009882E86|nr:germination protein YpeB [Sediminibacillus massiliensis]
MIRWILVALLAVGITATGIWGYQEHQEKNAILIQAENTYQRSFHDLSYHMDLLHEKIGTTLAMNTRSQLSPQLADIWRLTSEASTDVGQLPLALLPFNKTEEFLSDIGDFSYKAAIRDLDKEPLSENEVKSLQTLYQQSGEIKNELRKVQHVVLDNNLRWMDVQLALSTNDQQADNTIVDGFKTVEKTVKGYSEGNFGPTLTGTSKENHKFQNLQGEKISENQARKRARDLFDVGEDVEITVTKTGDGAQIPMYSASYQKDGKNGYLDISEKGGHPLSLMVNREVKEQKISLNEAMEKAGDYMNKLQLDGMEVFQSSQYDNVGVFNFLFKQDEVRIYPDSVQVKVALDNGDILGISARDFFMNHQERKIEEPGLSVSEAEETVNPNVQIQEHSLAVIENDMTEEVLVYEFLGTLENDTYRIFINANTGEEERVEHLKGTEEVFEESV